MDREPESRYWQESGEAEQPQRSGSVVDAAFRIDCGQLPADHAYLLSKAVETLLPWFPGEARAGIHAIHGAESGNGWQRPGDSGVIHLSRRVRLVLRIPRSRLESCGSLIGKTLNIADARIFLESVRVRELAPASTLFARRIITEREEKEEVFLDRVNLELAELKVTAPKQLPGRMIRISTPVGDLHARSLMLAELPAADSIRVQECGLGAARSLGCGLFVPHKSISAVNRPFEE